MLPISPCNTVGFRLMLSIALMVTTIMALAPQPELVTPDINDKLGHALAFAVLAFFTDASWPAMPFDWRKGIPLIAYGVFLECMQYFIPNRNFSIADMVADTAGIAIYLLLMLLVMQLLGTHSNTIGHHSDG